MPIPMRNQPYTQAPVMPGQPVQSNMFFQGAADAAVPEGPQITQSLVDEMIRLERQRRQLEQIAKAASKAGVDTSVLAPIAQSLVAQMAELDQAARGQVQMPAPQGPGQIPPPTMPRMR